MYSRLQVTYLIIGGADFNEISDVRNTSMKAYTLYIQ